MEEVHYDGMVFVNVVHSGWARTLGQALGQRFGQRIFLKNEGRKRNGVIMEYQLRVREGRCT
jgi:hypothetical protein